MASNYVCEGDVLQYVATAATVSGQVVVIGDLVGIALVNLASGETGSAMIEGVFEVAKVAGAAIAQGARVDWDASASAFAEGITTATGDVSGCGVAYEAAASAATSMKVRLTPGTGTAA